MDRKKDLWLRIRAYQFEHLVPTHLLERLQATLGGPDASTHAFANKMARKLGWTPRFALAAIEEYRKFLYLGMVAPFQVTPPRVIDQVWHEHLLFTRGYREFCDQVLKREFDHHPELMPSDEQTAEFQAQYDATCELYASEFDRVPPAAFWGVPKFAGRDRPAERREPRRRPNDDATGYSSGDSGAPLHASFSDGHGGHSAPEFGGGESGGGGSGADWGDAGADSSGDAGGGDSGGSGCSSGCGGGGGD